ncbi:MAG: hypothetical protein AAF221_09085 [Pseudomonadota bacterium]
MDPRLQPGSYTLWQRILAIGVAILSLIGAAVAGVFLLYIILTLVALVVIAAAIFTIWRRFFVAGPSRPPGHENMEIKEDAQGVIIDVEPEAPRRDEKR